MSARFYSWSLVLIVSLVVSGLCLRELAVLGVPTSESLMARGLGSLGIVLAFAYWKGLSLWPKRAKVQVYRALLAGLALSAFTLSYEWLTASAVAVLSNVDVPLLVVMGPWFGIPASRHVRGLALLSTAFLVWYVCGLEDQLSLVYGLLSLLVGSFLLCFGYWFIKKSMAEENEAVTILTPSLALVFYGCLERFMVPELGVAWAPSHFGLAALSGASMFGAYYATMRLYEEADLATAEFPTLLSSLVIQPLESLFLGAPFQWTYLFSAFGFLLSTYLLLRWQSREDRGSIPSGEAAHA